MTQPALANGQAASQFSNLEAPVKGLGKSFVVYGVCGCRHGVLQLWKGVQESNVTTAYVGCQIRRNLLDAAHPHRSQIATPAQRTSG